MTPEFTHEMNRYYNDQARQYGTRRNRLICWLQGHRWIPRGPFIAEPDGGVPILYNQCHRCYEWIGPEA